MTRFVGSTETNTCLQWDNLAGREAQRIETVKGAVMPEWLAGGIFGAIIGWGSTFLEWFVNRDRALRETIGQQKARAMQEVVKLWPELRAQYTAIGDPRAAWDFLRDNRTGGRLTEFYAYLPQGFRHEYEEAERLAREAREEQLRAKPGESDDHVSRIAGNLSEALRCVNRALEALHREIERQ